VLAAFYQESAKMKRMPFPPVDGGDHCPPSQQGLPVTPIATEHVIINGHRIAHGVYGEGTPVVLVHGTPSASIIWRKLVPVLCAAGFKVHVFDLLGFGESERPWSHPFPARCRSSAPCSTTGAWAQPIWWRMTSAAAWRNGSASSTASACCRWP
jgi:alpha/beta hydrolase fold